MKIVSNSVRSIWNYKFSSKDELLVDTNIWYYVYGPQAGNDEKTNIYSRALAEMLAAESKIFINVLIVSEFINRWSRFEYNLLKGKNKIDNFKHYRDSEKYQGVAKDISDAIKRILGQTCRVGSGFDSMKNNEIELVIDNFVNNCHDFNDQMLAELCKRENYKLVTNDIDFKNFDIEILTANRLLVS